MENSIFVCKMGRMYAQREKGAGWLPYPCTGHLVAGLPFFQNWGQWKRSLASNTSVLPAFLSTEIPLSIPSLGPNPFVCNEGSSVSVSLHPTTLSLCPVIDQLALFFSMLISPPVFPLLFLSDLSCSPSFFLYYIPSHSPLPSLPLSPLVRLFAAGPGDIQCPGAVSWRQLHL